MVFSGSNVFLYPPEGQGATELSELVHIVAARWSWATGAGGVFEKRSKRW
jgi:hypothetical protein